MVSLFDLPKAQRAKIADQIAAASANMTHGERVLLIEQLTELTEVDARAEAKASQKKQAIANIQACRSGSLAERNMINALEGTLRRAGVSLDDIVETPEKIDTIFASASRPLTPEVRMGIKGQLHRLGVIGK